MLTIIAALQDEIRLLRNEMELETAIHQKGFAIFIGKLEGKELAIVRSGMGPKAMKKAVDFCIKETSPSELINIGYAGGLDPFFEVGDIAIGSVIADQDSEKEWKSNAELVTKAKNLLEKTETRGRDCKIVTVTKPICDPHDKAFIGTKFAAGAVDMESAPMAAAATEAGIPFVIIRSILDPLDTLLAEFPEGSIENGKLDLFKYLGGVKKNPKDLLKLPKMAFLSNQARIAMTNFMKEWIKNV